MEKLFPWAVNHDKISVLFCPSFKFIKTLKGLDMEIDNINYDINFRDMPSVICKDFVFDKVKLHACVLHYNCEKTYPVGKIHKGIFILRGDDENHNGDCNPIHSIDKLVEDNELTEVFDSFEMQNKNKNYKHYCVYGTNL